MIACVSPRWLTAFLNTPRATAPAARAFWQQVTQSTLSGHRGSAGEFATLLPGKRRPRPYAATRTADMTTMTTEPGSVTGGVDTHRDIYVSAGVVHICGVLGTARFATAANATGACCS